MQPSSSRTRPLIVISDAAALGDDGSAIALLLSAPNFEIKLIAATSGNVWAEQAFVNLRALMAALGRSDIPVCVGMPARSHTARLERYRADVEAGVKPNYAGALTMPLPNTEGQESHELSPILIEAIARERPVDLLVIGPATAAAAAIASGVATTETVRRIYLMGGAISVPGNVTGAAEFNFWFDPAAADVLLGSQIPVTLLPLDATRGLSYPESLRPRLDPASPAAALLAMRLDSRRGASSLWDEVLAAVMMFPALSKRESALQLAVNTVAGKQYGACFAAHESGRRSVQTILRVNQDEVLRSIERSLKRAS